MDGLHFMLLQGINTHHINFSHRPLQEHIMKEGKRKGEEREAPTYLIKKTNLPMLDVLLKIKTLAIDHPWG